MKKILLSLILITICVYSSASDIVCSKGDSSKVVSLLQKARRLPSNTNYMIYFARQLKDIPYVAHTLDIDKNKEKLIINLHQLDCTTYVETVTSLSLCVKNHKYDFNSYANMLKTLRYRDGKMIDYTSRLHYFTEWIIDNSLLGFVKEIQSPNPPFTAIQNIKVGYMSDNPQSYPALKSNPKFLTAIKRSEQSLNGRRYRYIPKSIINNNDVMRKAVKDGDIIAIITNKKGLDTSHLGIAVWHKDGLHLLNASQLRHKVVEEQTTFYNYLSQHPVQIGIRVVRLSK